MPLKPIFDKAPLTAMTSQPLRAGLVRAENATLNKLYAMTANTSAPSALEGTFRLACVVNAKPCEEPVAAKIRALLDNQKADGSFDASLQDSVAILRAAWAMYEYEARKPMLDHIARWCAYAVQNWDALMADDAIWLQSADLLELLENLYRVTGKSAVLSLCEHVATQTMGWASVLNTISSQRSTSRAVTIDELTNGMTAENNSREGYYSQFFRTNHPETLADGARSTMAKGWYSGSATELNATRTGWERLYRYHGAVCGGLTADELLEGTSPAAAISTAALGAWAEALCTAATSEKPEWAWLALERMVYNAMPACLAEDKLLAFQRVNALTEDVAEQSCFYVSPQHQERALNRLVRGYAAVAASAVTACPDGAIVNLYLAGRYAIPMGDQLLILTVSSTPTGMSITVHCKQETKAVVRLRMPVWSKNTEVIVNGSDNHGDTKNGMLAFDRTWHDGDVISLTFEQTLSVADGHHQGKYVLRGPVLMALSAQEQNWRMAFAGASVQENRVYANLSPVKTWKETDGVPADLPVLPECEEQLESLALTPYAKTKARIALFPGRKQA